MTLSTIGFGMGNYKDALMERLADQGNGNNFYIDSPAAARRVFVDQLAANLEVLARDVKLQVELDPELVARYRRAARNLNEHERGRAEKALDHLNM